MIRLAFYDFDGTVVSGNIVERYAFFARRLPSRTRALVKCAKLIILLPLWAAIEFRSRRLFNEVFFREYRGMRREWLSALEPELFERVIRPSIYPGAKALIDSDRAAGFSPVLVTGELDFAVAPAVRYFGFDTVISNSLAYVDGAATGQVVPPLIASREKVEAMKRLATSRGASLASCKAYSDSFSDIPMLESVGTPVAVNPDRRLRRTARERQWRILSLRSTPRNEAG